MAKTKAPSKNYMYDSYMGTIHALELDLKHFENELIDKSTHVHKIWEVNSDLKDTITQIKLKILACKRLALNNDTNEALNQILENNFNSKELLYSIAGATTDALIEIDRFNRSKLPKHKSEYDRKIDSIKSELKYLETYLHVKNFALTTIPKHPHDILKSMIEHIARYVYLCNGSEIDNKCIEVIQDIVKEISEKKQLPRGYKKVIIDAEKEIRIKFQGRINPRNNETLSKK